MPDLLQIFSKRWKFTLTITLLATIVAAIAVLLSPKKYLSIATALPSSSVAADKAKIFNSNIEGLYSEFGSPDELERIEGTATLDTVFIAAAKELNLTAHYSIDTSNHGVYKAALELKKNTDINRSSYGELKVKVWDKNKNRAAEMANYLMNRLQQLHQHLLHEGNSSVLEILKKELEQKQQLYIDLATGPNTARDTLSGAAAEAQKEILRTKITAVSEQILQYEKLIDQYQLSIKTNAPVLLIVENARPALWPDKPKIVQTIAFVFFGAILFSFLIALFLERRNQKI